MCRVPPTALCPSTIHKQHTRVHASPPPHLGTSALGMVSATVALVTTLPRCMMRRLLVRPTSRHRSPRARGGDASSRAAHTCYTHTHIGSGGGRGEEHTRGMRLIGWLGEQKHRRALMNPSSAAPRPTFARASGGSAAGE